ncbi:MAG: PKD domain-containing protein, partial [Brumimicrobium sp.]
MFLLKDKILYSINPTRFLAFLVLVIFIASSQRLNAQLCQLSIDSSLPSDTTDCGDCFTLTAIGEDDVPLLESNFNNNSLGPGWSSNVTVMYSNPCGAPPDGTPAAWFGLGTQPREMETVDYNVSCGGEICFEMKYATQGGSGNCEGPDLVGEGVYLQYSTNGGATWINIQYHPPNGGYDPQLTQWNEYCYNIPVAAQTNSTRFRWFQDVGSGAMFDHWGLDNIYVTGTNCGTFYYDWGADGSENVADTNVCLDGNEQTYNVIYTDGLSDTCSASITIYSDLQVELDADTLICGLTEIDLVPTTSGGSGNFDYEWSTGDVTPQLDDVDTTSLYWVEITDIDHPNCNNRDSAMIEIYPNPDIDFSVFPLCLGVPSEFEDATTLPDGYNIDSWNWNFDDNGATSNDQNPIHSFSDVGDYDVTLTVVTENGCDSDSTRMITVDPQPVADFNFEDVCHGETTMFTDESTGDYATTDWDFDDGSPINTESDPAHEYAEDGDYNVTLIITSASGVCGDTITQNV